MNKLQIVYTTNVSYNHLWNVLYHQIRNLSDLVALETLQTQMHDTNQHLTQGKKKKKKKLAIIFKSVKIMSTPNVNSIRIKQQDLSRKAVRGLITYQRHVKGNEVSNRFTSNKDDTNIRQVNGPLYFNVAPMRSEHRKRE